MANIGNVVQFLLSKEPPAQQGRLALYHYLKNLKDLKDPFTRTTLQEFFLRSLSHQYWQDHKEILTQGILEDLKEFQKLNSLGFELSDILWPSQTQVFSLENFENVFLVVQRSLEKEKEASSKYQLIKLPNGKLLALMLHANGTLTVMVYSSGVYVKTGELQPMPPETKLQYSASMELAEETPQLLTSSLMSFCQFALVAGECAGVRLKGFTYQKEEVLTGTMVQRPDLFYPIKSLERFFIKPESDPFYVELTRILQKANELIQVGHPDQEKIAKEAFKRGQMALKNIFPDDKLLQLLVSNLQHSLIKLGDAGQPKLTSMDQGGSQCQTIRPLSL
ncbi:MAG: hypothetical protein KDD61_15245 [Bdellovibrionales bacterium]|nr:hypothetical protein [Bdellovibrionales bacterium]